MGSSRTLGLVCIVIVVLVAGCAPLVGLETTLPARTTDPPTRQLTVTLVDRSGLATAIRPSDPVENMNPVDAVPGTNAVRVTWLGSECDTHTTLTMAYSGIRLGISVRSDQAPTAILGCSAVGIRRQVIIELRSYVPSTQFSLSQP